VFGFHRPLSDGKGQIDQKNRKGYKKKKGPKESLRANRTNRFYNKTDI
jgi:hypothetical protein